MEPAEELRCNRFLFLPLSENVITSKSAAWSLADEWFEVDGYSPNLLLDAFELNTINRLWVTDITYIPIAGRRFVYLSMVMDRFSRRIIGWRLNVTMTEELVIGSLKDAIASRQPGGELIHYSDRGGPCAGNRSRQILKHSSIRQSMSRAGDL